MWRKIAFIRVPATGLAWMHSHCQLPVALPLKDSPLVRILFASRTAGQRSHIGYVDLEFGDDEVRVSSVSSRPVLAPGPAGFFDEHGVYPSSVVVRDGRAYLYYIGWNQGVEAPLFYASIGLAVSEDGERFERVSEAPIMARSQHDPCLVTSPHVFVEGDLWRMTYVSGFKWDREPVTGTLKSFYDIKYAESSDGINWRREGLVAVGLREGESNIARSSVIRMPGGPYRMWYSYVHAKYGRYRIGYAESPDGRAWTRKDDECGISIGDGFTKEMICYPSVFMHLGRVFMLYNGDDFGRDGFGVAVSEHPWASSAVNA